MTKFPLILSLFLFLFTNVFGQTDSSAASATKDTNPARANAIRDSTLPGPKIRPHGKEGDSGLHMQDTTLLPAPKHVLKKPTAATSQTPAPGSANPGASSSNPAAGSANPVAGSAAAPTGPAVAPTGSAAAAPAAPRDSTPVTGSFSRKEGPTEMTMWKSLLAADSFFHFMGKPVSLTEPIHRPNSKDSLFYLLLGILFYFALFRIFFEKYFNNLLTLFFRVSLRQQQIREQVLQTPLPSLLLNLLFIASGGLFAAYLLHFSRSGASINFWILYLDCMMGLGLIYLVKFLVLKFCGWVFNISRATDIYIFITFLVNKMVGIFLLPLLILITFSDLETRDIFITISLTMVFVLLGYRVFASYRPVRSEIKLTPFHYFMYICAFEIAPLLLIYKVLLQYLEKVY